MVTTLTNSLKVPIWFQRLIIRCNLFLNMKRHFRLLIRGILLVLINAIYFLVHLFEQNSLSNLTQERTELVVKPSIHSSRHILISKFNMNDTFLNEIVISIPFLSTFFWIIRIKESCWIAQFPARHHTMNKKDQAYPNHWWLLFHNIRICFWKISLWQQMKHFFFFFASPKTTSRAGYFSKL